jgi:hypothetical protein
VVGLVELADACNYTEEQFVQQQAEPELEPEEQQAQQAEPELEPEEQQRARARVCITDASNTTIDIMAYEDLVLDVGGSRMRLSFERLTVGYNNKNKPTNKPSNNKI